MRIDLHVHSRDCSDGKMTVPDLFAEARRRNIGMLSITDHDSIGCQEWARVLAREEGIRYICGVELSISFAHPEYRNGKAVSLDVLGYGCDPRNRLLGDKLQALREHRRRRAGEILEKINRVLIEEHQSPLTPRDLKEIEGAVDGAFGRPHIANHMVKRGMVRDRQEAFDRYLVRCNVPKMPLSLEEASELIRTAGGRAVLAHPNDPRGTSLVKLTEALDEQQAIIAAAMLPYLDGIECYHSRHDSRTAASYREFAEKKGLMVTGGSDCHQQPVLLGTVDVPASVAEQFDDGGGEA